MEKELVGLFDKVKKAADAAAASADGEADSSRCLEALAQLKKLPVNYDVLVSTQIGKHLRKLTKHPRKSIQDMASDVVETWKEIIVKKTVASKKIHEGSTVIKAAEPEGVSTAPKLNSSAMVYTKDPIRDKVRDVFAKALCKVTTEDTDIDACDPYRVAVAVESAMFQKWGKSTGAYKAKYRSIIFNIKDTNNPDFRRKVLLGQIPPHWIVDLTAEDMASDARRKQNAEIKEKALFDCGRPEKPKASTSEFQCMRCRKRECTYYQMQTRSADEPMTTFITCVNCDKRWKK